MSEDRPWIRQSLRLKVPRYLVKIRLTLPDRLGRIRESRCKKSNLPPRTLISRQCGCQYQSHRNYRSASEPSGFEIRHDLSSLDVGLSEYPLFK